MDSLQSHRVTRLAPSPTGALHLGNARTFMINWALARQNNWHIVLRIEDLDGPRIKPGADQLAIDDLAWLGMDWDTQAPHQSFDLTPYKDALEKLAGHSLTYPCTCSRRDIENAQSAPHASLQKSLVKGTVPLLDESTSTNRYPGTCRDRPFTVISKPNEYATRLRIPDEIISFKDQIRGQQSINVQQQVGDFVIANKLGLPAYQLAVVVDDARQNITDIVRGDDLLTSAARQLWLYRFLDITALPRYWHLPMVIGEDGRRLAKRHGDTRLATYRDQGIDPDRIVGLIAFWSGIIPSRTPMPPAAFLNQFDLSRLPPHPVTYTAEDHRWLIASS